MILGRSIRRRLVAGQPVTDAYFDKLYDEELQRVSRKFWTPVAIALQAVEWLTSDGARRVLDVGAGPGKLVLIGATMTDAAFFGLEQRSHLVAAAREAALRLDVTERATFQEGVIEDVDLTTFDALYFFNPFGENLYSEEERLDATVELGEARYHRDLAVIEAALEALPMGARMVTYHGFGGRIPDTFELVGCKGIGTDYLRLWVKARPASTHRNYLIERGRAEPGDAPVYALARAVRDRPKSV